jgi:hypothetical protein
LRPGQQVKPFGFGAGRVHDRKNQRHTLFFYLAAAQSAERKRRRSRSLRRRARQPVPQRAIEYPLGSATHAWKATCLPYPFYRTGNPQGISKLDVFSLHTRVSSKSGNTNASHYRAEVVSMITRAKEAHVERMVESGIPFPMVAPPTEHLEGTSDEDP